MYKASVIATPLQKNQNREEEPPSRPKREWRWIRSTLCVFPIFLYFLSLLGFSTYATFIHDAAYGFCQIAQDIPFFQPMCQMVPPSETKSLRVLSPELPPPLSVPRDYPILQVPSTGGAQEERAHGHPGHSHYHSHQEYVANPYPYPYPYGYPSPYDLPLVQQHYVTIVPGYPGVLPPQPIQVRSKDQVVFRNNDLQPHQLVYVANDYRQEQTLFPHESYAFHVPESNHLWRQFIYSAGEPKRVFLDLNHIR